MNLVLYIMTFNKWDGMQDWFWNEADKDFIQQVVAVCLGVLQYYYLFLVACWGILVLVFTCIWCCSYGAVNPFREDM